MYAVLIKGFPTKKEANDFVSWYDGQGEQNAAIWFEISNEDNGSKVPMTCYGETAKKILAESPIETIEMAIEMQE